MAALKSAWIVSVAALGCNTIFGIEHGHLVSVDAGSGASGSSTGGAGGQMELDGGSTGGAATGGTSGGSIGTGGLRADGGPTDAGAPR